MNIFHFTKYKLKTYKSQSKITAHYSLKTRFKYQSSNSQTIDSSISTYKGSTNIQLFVDNSRSMQIVCMVNNRFKI